MKQFNIKITGSGTSIQLLKALEKVVEDIRNLTEEEMEQYEDENHILFTEIHDNGYYNPDKD